MARKETDLSDEQTRKLKWIAKHHHTSERDALRIALDWYYNITRFFSKIFK